MTVKLTKTELRTQQTRLTQFQRYLPTLQLKKAMLQFEVSQALTEIDVLTTEFKNLYDQISKFAPFLLEKVACNVVQYAEVVHVKKHYENIAGVEIPIFQEVVFREPEYFLFEAPLFSI